MANKKLKVGIAPTSPFVIEKNGEYSGFEIELWEMIAKEAGLKFEYVKKTFHELIPLMQQKKIDVAIAAITIKEEREEVIDFSHPTFASGLRILLSKNRAKIDFVSTFNAFVSQGYRQLLKPTLVLSLIIFIFGNILWFVEKNNGSFEPFYFPGIFQAIWLSLSMILGLDGGMFVYELTSWTGRLVGTLLQITSLAVLGLIIGEITAFITTKKIRLNIEGPDDLKGKIVATVKGSTSEDILKDFGAKVVTEINIDKAYENLKKNKVEAVVFDAPVLVYYANNEGSEWAEVVGELFDAQDYGIMLQEESELRKTINLAILKIREDGDYDNLYKKWFEESQEG